MALIHDGATGTGFGTDQQLGDLYYNFDIEDNPDGDAVTVRAVAGASSNMVQIQTPGNARGTLYANANNTDPKDRWAQVDTGIGIYEESGIIVVPS
jgi:hypothetical protein